MRFFTKKKLYIIPITLMLLIGVACESTAPAPAPAPAVPAAPAAPVAAGQAPVVIVPGAPTAIPARATATRVLPTPTATAGEAIKYGGTLKAAHGYSSDGFDPAYMSSELGLWVGYPVFHSLLAFDEGASIVPDLARSWDISGDSKTITFHLVKGAKFHDGTPFNAEAVKWNLDRIRDPEVASTRAGDLKSIESVTVVDDSTVSIKLSEAYRPQVFQLAMQAGLMVSPTAVKKYDGYANRNSDFAAKPIGAGSFRLKEYIPGQRTVLVKNDDYWEKGKPYLDKIVFEHIPDSSVRFAMVRTGEIDIVREIRADDVPKLKGNSKVKVREQLSGRTYAFHLSVDRDPWSNRALRQAIAFGIDREAMLKVVHGGAGTVAGSFMSATWAHNPEIRPYYYDVDQAKAKLAEAKRTGYDGEPVPFWTESRTISLQQTESLQAMMREIGIDMEIRTVPGGQGWRMTVEREIDFRATRWTPRVDIDIRIRNLFHSEGGMNFWGYNSPEVDRLFEEGASIYDTAKAKVIYDQLQTTLAEDAPFIYLWWGAEYTGVSSRLRNFTQVPDLQLRVRDIWLDR